MLRASREEACYRHTMFNAVDEDTDLPRPLVCCRPLVVPDTSSTLDSLQGGPGDLRNPPIPDRMPP